MLDVVFFAEKAFTYAQKASSIIVDYSSHLGAMEAGPRINTQ